jgi:2-keto-4-pentenoate hydratase/2-oxohepta-3-ene-1,7-dioic acid hydratase in catechol pathway
MAMFRLLTIGGRAALDVDGRWFDLARAAGDDTLGDPHLAVARFDELHDLAGRCRRGEAGPAEGEVTAAVLDAPIPRPGQVFAIGLNYADHAAESGMAAPPAPLTFTKFASSIAGPTADVPLSGTMVDWEVEIVAVIGRQCSQVPVAEAWDVVAGLTLGQDISDRAVQLTGTPPQFSLGKSFPAYSPIGPAIVSIDAFADPDDIGLWCDVGGERMQDSRTSQLIFSIPTLVAYLSSICTLEPGDLIFTGTPSGVGMGRGRYLVEGDVIASGADGIGELHIRCVAGAGPLAL